jgi:hypothetical protein
MKFCCLRLMVLLIFFPVLMQARLRVSFFTITEAPGDRNGFSQYHFSLKYNEKTEADAFVKNHVRVPVIKNPTGGYSILPRGIVLSLVNNSIKFISAHSSTKQIKLQHEIFNCSSHQEIGS